MASIPLQDYKRFEHILIDVASTDGSVDVIKIFLQAITTFISKPDKGIYNAFNESITLSTGATYRKLTDRLKPKQR